MIRRNYQLIVEADKDGDTLKYSISVTSKSWFEKANEVYRQLKADAMKEFRCAGVLPKDIGKIEFKRI